MNLLHAESNRIEIHGRHRRCLEGSGGNRFDCRRLPNRPATERAKATAKAFVCTLCDFIHPFVIHGPPDPRILDGPGTRADMSSLS